MRRLSFALLLLCCFLCVQERSARTSAGNILCRLVATAGVEQLSPPEGLKIELVASEPMISDLVAMEVDEHGNMYVLELHGYPWTLPVPAK